MILIHQHCHTSKIKQQQQKFKYDKMDEERKQHVLKIVEEYKETGNTREIQEKWVVSILACPSGNNCVGDCIGLQPRHQMKK